MSYDRTRVVELRAERAKIHAEAKKLIERSEAEKRALTPEEQGAWDKMMADIDALMKRIEAIEKLTATDPEADADGAPPPAPEDRGRTGAAYARAYTDYLRTGHWDRQHGVEARVFNTQVAEVGGAVVPPPEFLNELIAAVTNETFILRKARVIELTNSVGINVPSLATRMSDAAWTTEIPPSITPDSAMTFGGRQLRPNPLVKEARITRTWLRNSAVPADKIVRDELSRVMAYTYENAAMTGSGVNQPLGLFTASTHGISTNRDVTITVTSDTTKVNSLIDMVYSIRAGYKPEWLMHRSLLGRIRKLRSSGTGDLVWAVGLQPGQPDTILGYPVNSSEFAPSTFTQDSYVCLFGDLSNYWFARVKDMGIQVLNELFARSNQVGYLTINEADGMPVLEDAFARGKLSGDW